MEHPNNEVEIIPNRLYWISERSPPSNRQNFSYFCIDSHLVYRPFAADFGPLDIGKVFKFCSELNSLLRNPKLSNHVIYHYTSLQPAKRANAALLIGLYQILILDRSSEEVLRRFDKVSSFVPFCDASQHTSSFELTIKDCLSAVEKAISFNWFSLNSFDIRSYEANSMIDQGGLNWIVPNRVLAFICPSSEHNANAPLTPERYVPIFKKLGVRTIVRLNNKTYESSRFTAHGFKFNDLYFLDGSVPSEEIVKTFVQIVENDEIVAVHCKAGLGRTGTLIGCYVLKHYDMDAKEFIAWCRIMRPGSILGPQQGFLCDVSRWCKQWKDAGEEFSEKMGVRVGEGEYLARFGDYGQGARLAVKSSSPVGKSDAVSAKRMMHSPILRMRKGEEGRK